MATQTICNGAKEAGNDSILVVSVAPGIRTTMISVRTGTYLETANSNQDPRHFFAPGLFSGQIAPAQCI